MAEARGGGPGGDRKGGAVLYLIPLNVVFGSLDGFACLKPQESLEGAALCWVWLFYGLIS